MQADPLPKPEVVPEAVVPDLFLPKLNVCAERERGEGKEGAENLHVGTLRGQCVPAHLCV